MDLNSLNKIEELANSISEIAWFRNTSKKIGDPLKGIIHNYCKEIGINDNIIALQSWEEAIKVINSDKWNKDYWEIEEREKANLLNILLKSVPEKELFHKLSKLTIETTKIIEKYSIENLKKSDVKYHYYTKVAAGAAAISCYQAALALAANKNSNHIFISKFEIFKAGHWPLIITNNNFNIL